MKPIKTQIEELYKQLGIAGIYCDTNSEEDVINAKLQTLKECKKMFDDYNKKLKEEFAKCRDKTDIWADEGRWNKFEKMFKKEIKKLSKEVIGE